MIPCFPGFMPVETESLEFYQDGYEDVTVESMTEDMLDPSTYTKQSLKKKWYRPGSRSTSCPHLKNGLW